MDHEYLILAPLIENPFLKIDVVVAAYLLTLSLSGVMIRFFILPRHLPKKTPDPAGPRFDSSVVIGKCENILVITFILLGLETGMALVFTAKALARSDDIKKNPGFFLGGTMVNFIWAMIVGLVAKLLIVGI